MTDELFEDGEEKGQEGEDGETRGEEKGKEDGRGRRVSNKKRLAKLMERALLQVPIVYTLYMNPPFFKP